MGTTLFVLTSAGSGMSSDGVSRVIQGLATSIGFIGAGAILKLEQHRVIHGLTTAAGIGMTAAVGVTVGLGGLGISFNRHRDGIDRSSDRRTAGSEGGKQTSRKGRPEKY